MITSVPVPNEEGDEANRLRRQADEGDRPTLLALFQNQQRGLMCKALTTFFPDEVGENSVDSDKDLLSIGEECEEWPVQKVSTQNILIEGKDRSVSSYREPAFKIYFTVYSSEESGEESEPRYVLQVTEACCHNLRFNFS